jgi:hypothetical protein
MDASLNYSSGLLQTYEQQRTAILGGKPMISIKDCLDYSDLTEDEARVIAEHEHLPYASAVQLACGLAQSEEGTEVLRCLLENAVCDAENCKHAEAVMVARRAYEQFVANHPEHWSV